MKKLQFLSLTQLKLGAIKPKGWLHKRLITQAKGLSGHLDEFWPDVMKIGWIGGKADDWEHFSYWLDGVVPLGYHINSPSLIQKVEYYIKYILDHQQEDGWLGLVSKKRSNRYDPWWTISGASRRSAGASGWAKAYRKTFIICEVPR